MDWKYYRKKIVDEKIFKDNWFVIGIDLGTTNTVASYWSVKDEKPITIDMSDGFGKVPMPSVVQYRDDSKEWVVGYEAFNTLKIYEETTIRSIKRKMGTKEVITLGDKDYLPEEITAKILESIINNCYKINPNAEIAGVIITIPYSFDNSAKKATLDACKIVGIEENILALIEEPKVVTLTYSLKHQFKKDEKMLIFDFGGGTLDLTLFKVNESDNKGLKLNVISEGGKGYHGGDNIDEILLNEGFRLIKEKTGLSKGEINTQHRVELFLKVVDAKERLSKTKKSKIPYTFCIPPFVQSLSKEEYEELIHNFIEQTKTVVLQCLKNTYYGAIEPSEIDKIILLGGSSKNIWVKDLLVDIFGDKEKIYISEKPELDISVGATYLSAMKMGLIEEKDISSTRYEIKFETVVSHDIGLIVSKRGKKKFLPLIQRGTPYKLAKKSKTFKLSASTEEEMTEFSLELFERINLDDDIDDCKFIGKVQFSNLPKRPIGKTKLKVTLSVVEGGLVKGIVEDLGYNDEFLPSGYLENFEPNKYSTVVVGG